MSKVNLEPVRAHVQILEFAREKEAEIKKLRASAEEAIKEVLGNQDIGELDGKTVVTWTTHKKRQFQQKAFREAHPELAEEFTDLVEARTFKFVE